MATSLPFLQRAHLFRNSSGVPYVVGSNQSNIIQVYRGNSTTPTSFTAQDTGNQVDGLGQLSAAIDKTGVIHIAFRRNAAMGGTNQSYITFNTNTNTFGSVEQIMADSLVTSTVPQLSLDTNNIPHVFSNIFVTNMGSSYETIVYTNRSGGSWAAYTTVRGAPQTQNWSCRASGIAPNGYPFCVGLCTSPQTLSIFHADAVFPTPVVQNTLTTSVSGYGTNNDVKVAISSSGAILVQLITPTNTGRNYYKPAANALSGTWNSITTDAVMTARIAVLGTTFYQINYNTTADRWEYRVLDTSGTPTWGALQTTGGPTPPATDHGVFAIEHTQYFTGWNASGVQVGEYQTTNVRSSITTYTENGTTGNWDTWTLGGGGGGSASLGQAGFRFRNDNGSETTATWAAALNTNFTLAPISNPDFRLRFLVRNTGGASATKAFKLQYSKNSGAYADITTSTGAEVHVRNSANITNGVATTEQLAGAGTFVAGQVMDTAVASSSITLAAGEDTEVEFCLGSVAASLANNDTLDFRLVDNTGSVVLDSYSQTPRATVSKPAVVGLEQVTWTRTNNQFVEGSDLTGSPSTYPSPGAVEVYTLNWDPAAIYSSSRWRFLVKNTSGSQISAAFKIQCRVNNGAGFGAWTDLPAQSDKTAGVWTLYTNNSVITNGEPTTQRIGSGSFVPGQVMETSNTTGTITLDPGQETEVAWSTTMPWEGTVADDATFELRLVKSTGDVLDSYLAYPSGSFKDVNVTQSAFRFRNDDGTESTATWQAVANTNVNQTVGNRFRLRFRLQGTGNDGDTSAALSKKLQYRKDDQTGGGFGPWTFVGPGAEVDFSASPNVANDATTTEQLGGTGTFWGGRFIEQTTTSAGDLPQPAGAEYEFSLVLDGPLNLNDDRFEYRMLHYAETPFRSYTTTPDHRAIKPPAVAQQTFRFRNDDGSEATATWRQAANTNDSITITGATNVIRLRFGVRETSRAALTDGFTYQFRVNGGAWQTVAGGTTVEYATGSQLTHNGSTTQQITTGTFLAGRQTESTVAPTTVAFTGRERSEFEAAFNLNAANFTSGDVVDFRLVYDGVTTLDAYDVTPSLTVTVTAGSHSLSGNAIDGGAPAVDPKALGQVHTLSGGEILGAAAAVDSSTLVQTYALIGDEVLGAAVVDSSAMMQAHALIGTAITAGAPAIAQGTLAQPVGLSGNEITLPAGGAGDAVTFGESSGNTTSVGGAANEEHLYRVSLAESMDVTGLSIKFGPSSGRTGQFRLTLRNNNAGVPGTLITTTATANEGDYADFAVADLPVTPVTLVAGTYWLGVHMGGQAVETAAKATGGERRGKLADAFADGTSSAPGSYTDFGGTIALLVWARGTASVGGSLVDSGTLTQAHTLVGSPVDGGVPALDAGVVGQAGDLVGTPITAAAPVVDSGTLGQAQILGADPITTPPAAVDAGVLAQVQGLTASEITCSGAAIDAGVLSQAHGLTATDLSTGPPALDAPTLSQSGGTPGNYILLSGDAQTGVDHLLLSPGPGKVLISGAGGTPTGNPITTPAPAIDSGVLGQTHVLTGDAVAATPTLDSPTLSQSHVLVGAEVSATPVLDSPLLAETHYQLSVDSITGSAPVLDSPVLGELGALVGDEITLAPPAVDNGTLTQAHALGGDAIALGAPAIDAAPLGQTHALAGDELTTTPVLDSPVLSEGETLFGNEVVVTPVLGSPALAQAQTLAGDPITLGAPVAAAGTLGGTQDLVGDPVTGGAPALDSGTIGQLQTLFGDAAVGSAPTLDPGALSQGHALTSDEITTASPVVDSGALTQAHALTGDAVQTQPAVGQAVLVGNQSLVGDGVQLTPEVGTADVSQTSGFPGTAITLPPPVVDQGVLEQLHPLRGDDIRLQSPRLERELVGQIVHGDGRTQAARSSGRLVIAGERGRTEAPGARARTSIATSMVRTVSVGTRARTVVAGQRARSTDR